MPAAVELQQVRGGGLRSVDLRVEAGERVGVLGLPGSGASFVAPLAAGTVEPDAGRVVREGRDVTTRPIGDRPGGLGWVSRHPEPFSSLSVFENVLVAALANRRWRRRFAEAHARRAVERVGLAPVADLGAHQLDAEGRCRLEVARVITAPRRLLLVDHLGEGLGPAVRVELADALAEVAAAGAALLWVDGVDRPPAGVDRLVVLAQGRIVAEGARHDVLAGADLHSLVRRAEAPLRTTGPPPGVEPLLEVGGWRWAGGPDGDGAGIDLVLGRAELALAGSASPTRASGFLRSLVGLEPGEGGLHLDGADLAKRRTRARVGGGLGFVPATGGLDPASTVADHLALGRAGGRRGPWGTGELLRLLPELAPRRGERVGDLIALESRLTSIGRALAGNPRVLLVEEPLADLDAAAAVVVTDALAAATRHTAVLVAGARFGPLLAKASRTVDLDASGGNPAPAPAAPSGPGPGAVSPPGEGAPV